MKLVRSMKSNYPILHVLATTVVVGEDYGSVNH